MRRSPSLAIAFLAVSVLLFIALVSSLSLTGPTWSPNVGYRNSTLTCSWTKSADTTAQNITFLKDGVVFNSSYENPATSTTAILAGVMTKGETWTCNVTLMNGTDNVSATVDILIRNTAPTTNVPPSGVFNASNPTQDIGYIVQIREGDTFTINVNATDVDGDALSYFSPLYPPGYNSSNYFCTQSSPLNVYACHPSQVNLVNNSVTTVNVSFLVGDGTDFGGRQNVMFNITPVNAPPNVTLTFTTTTVNQSLNYSPITISDEESGTPYTVIFNSVPAQIAPRLSLTSLNANSTSFSIYYDGSGIVFADVGLWNISVNVTDTAFLPNGSNDSKTRTASYLFNITPVGRRPYFVNISANITAPYGGPYNVLQGQPINITVSANDTDGNATITFISDLAHSVAIVGTKNDTNTSPAIGQIIYTPSNADVGLWNVTLTIVDQTTLTNTTTLQFNVTNVNDAPVINEISLDSRNRPVGTDNASNLTGYSNTPFVYVVSVTDPDTPYGDVLTYTDNSSLFDINATTGVISFTPQPADIGGPYAINITVADNGTPSLSGTRIFYLTITANLPPHYTVPVPLPQLNCTNIGASCYYNISSVAIDDNGDNLTYGVSFVGASISEFVYNATSGIINFTPQKSSVGNYTLSIVITDTFGASNTTTMNLHINNTPQRPNFLSYDFSNEAIFATHTFIFPLTANDTDLKVSSAAEALTFSTNITSPVIGFSSVTVNSTAGTASTLLFFTPNATQNGTYTINLTVNDTLGLSDSKVFSFVVLPKAELPNLSQVTPWGQGAGHDLTPTYINITDPVFVGGRTAFVTFDENTTVFFNATVNDPLGLNLTYNWTVNGTQVNTSVGGLPKYFGFYSSGRYLVYLNVSNNGSESVGWTWDLTVRDVNRPPALINPLDAIQPINLSTKLTDYLARRSTLQSQMKFFDPDQDLNQNGVYDDNESIGLTFTTNDTCAVATISIAETNITLIPTQIGSCSVYFIASDGNYSVSSNVVQINVTDLPQGNQPIATIVSTGGGGGSSTISTFVPINKKRENPKAFNLIAPKLVTIYNNKSVDIPITINNTWDTPLKMVRLTATSNATGVKMAFDTDIFEEIPANTSKQVTLTVSNYRLGGNYEISVSGNVSDPAYSDNALILLNSIEQSADGEDVKVKVTFANDLLNEHPECQELNEVLDQAKKKIADGNFAEGGRLVDGVINGCKYLVSTQQRVQEKPSRLNPIINIDDLSVKAIMLGVLAFVVLSSLAFLIYYHYTHKPEDDI